MEPITVLTGILGLIIAVFTVAKLIIEPIVKLYGFRGSIKDQFHELNDKVKDGFHGQAMINQDLRNSLLSLQARVKHLEDWATGSGFNERKNEYRHNPMSDSDFVRKNPD